MKKLQAIPLVVLCLALSACGDGGGSGGVASTPAPIPSATTSSTTTAARTPLPPTPATTSGTYSAISTFYSDDGSNSQKVTLPNGQVTYQGIQRVADLQLAPPGSVSIAVDAATRTYTLTAAVGPFQFPTDQMTMAATSDLGYTRNVPLTGGSTDPNFYSPAARVARGDLVVHGTAAGTSDAGLPRSMVSFVTLYNVGQLNDSPRYVSFASWGQFYQEATDGVLGSGNTKPLQMVHGLMVFGQRTGPDELPLSGKATYELHSFLNPPSTDDYGNVSDVLGKTVLSVDFATRGLTGQYNADAGFDTYKTDSDGNTLVDDNGDPLISGHVDTSIRTSGSTTIANDGGFKLGLTGNGTLHTTVTGGAPVADVIKPVSGALTGAFFGPQAAEVGGIAELPTIVGDGSVYQNFTDFVGKKAP